MKNIIKYQNLEIEFQDITHALSKSDLLSMRNLDLVLNNQVHSNKVKIITKDNIHKIEDADALITTEKNIKLAVYTADCLPIVFYDKISEKVAIAHAGWQGTASQISLQVLKHFNNIKDVKVYIGPSAKSCCYKIDALFLEKLFTCELFTCEVDKNIIKKCTEKRDALYFNLQLCNILQMQNYGILNKNINLKYNICTICNLSYCSYRREKNNLNRQLTIASLK